MKNYNYTARDANGITKRGCINAVDRHDALRLIKAQNLIPQSVVEDSMANQGTTLSLSPRMLISGLTLLALLAGLLVWWYAPKSDLEKKTVVKKAKHSVSQASKLKTKMAETNAVVVSAPVPAVGNAAQSPEGSAGNTRASAYRNVPKEGPIDEQKQVVKKPRAFSSGTEQVLSMIMNKKIGDTPPPLPNLPLNERTNIVMILNKDIIVYDDDNEQMIQQKANVAHAKQLLKEYINQGGSPEDFLWYYRDQLTQANKEWMTAQKTLLELHKTDREAALKYGQEQGKILSEKGIKPLMLPSR